MTVIIAVYAGIMFLLSLMYGCFSDKKTYAKQESSKVSIDSSDNMDKVEIALKKSDTALSNIEKTFVEHNTLLKENKQLRIELKSTKDSLVATKNMLKKRTFIQKILGTNKDTIQSKNDTAN